MPIYSYTEFADLCGIKPGQLAVYQKRDRIEYTEGEDGKVYIDTDIQKNMDFYIAKIERLKHEPPAPKEKKRSSPGRPKKIEQQKQDPEVKPVPRHVQNQQKRREDAEKRAVSGSKHDLDLQKIRAEIDKKHVDIRNALLQEQILRGKLISSADMKALISDLSNNFINNYKDFATSFLTNVFHKYKVSLEDQADIKRNLIAGINKTHDVVFDKAAQRIKESAKTAIIEEEDVQRGMDE